MRKDSINFFKFFFGGASKNLELHRAPKEVALKVFHQTDSVSETIRILGYPTKKQLYNWIASENATLKNVNHFHELQILHTIQEIPSLEVKLDAIKRCFEQGENIKYVSEEISYSSSSIY